MGDASLQQRVLLDELRMVAGRLSALEREVELEARLTDVEERLTNLERRLTHLEGDGSPVPPSPAPTSSGTPAAVVAAQKELERSEDNLRRAQRAARSCLVCRFCGKGRAQVQSLIAGPAASICDECVDLCSKTLRARSESPQGVHS